MRIHISVAFYVLLAAIVTKLNAAEWIAVLICIAMVMGTELINTSVESICDALHPGYSEKIGAAKDLAAGAVLGCAVISAVIGGIIFFNVEKVMRAVSFAQEHVVLAAAILLTVPVLTNFVFRRK